MSTNANDEHILLDLQQLHRAEVFSDDDEQYSNGYINHSNINASTSAAQVSSEDPQQVYLAKEINGALNHEIIHPLSNVNEQQILSNISVSEQRKQLEHLPKVWNENKHVNNSSTIHTNKLANHLLSETLLEPNYIKQQTQNLNVNNFIKPKILATNEIIFSNVISDDDESDLYALTINQSNETKLLEIRNEAKSVNDYGNIDVKENELKDNGECVQSLKLNDSLLNENHTERECQELEKKLTINLDDIIEIKCNTNDSNQEQRIQNNDFNTAKEGGIEVNNDRFMRTILDKIKNKFHKRNRLLQSNSRSYEQNSEVCNVNANKSDIFLTRSKINEECIIENTHVIESIQRGLNINSNDVLKNRGEYCEFVNETSISSMGVREIEQNIIDNDVPLESNVNNNNHIEVNDEQLRNKEHSSPGSKINIAIKSSENILLNDKQSNTLIEVATSSDEKKSTSPSKQHMSDVRKRLAEQRVKYFAKRKKPSNTSIQTEVSNGQQSVNEFNSLKKCKNNNTYKGDNNNHNNVEYVHKVFTLEENNASKEETITKKNFSDNQGEQIEAQRKEIESSITNDSNDYTPSNSSSLYRYNCAEKNSNCGKNENTANEFNCKKRKMHKQKYANRRKPRSTKVITECNERYVKRDPNVKKIKNIISNVNKPEYKHRMQLSKYAMNSGHNSKATFLPSEQSLKETIVYEDTIHDADEESIESDESNKKFKQTSRELLQHSKVMDNINYTQSKVNSVKLKQKSNKRTHSHKIRFLKLSIQMQFHNLRKEYGANIARQMESSFNAYIDDIPFYSNLENDDYIDDDATMQSKNDYCQSTNINTNSVTTSQMIEDRIIRAYIVSSIQCLTQTNELDMIIELVKSTLLTPPFNQYIDTGSLMKSLKIINDRNNVRNVRNLQLTSSIIGSDRNVDEILSDFESNTEFLMKQAFYVILGTTIKILRTKFDEYLKVKAKGAEIEKSNQNIHNDINSLGTNTNNKLSAKETEDLNNEVTNIFMNSNSKSKRRTQNNLPNQLHHQHNDDNHRSSMFLQHEHINIPQIDTHEDISNNDENDSLLSAESMQTSISGAIDSSENDDDDDLEIELENIMNNKQYNNSEHSVNSRSSTIFESNYDVKSRKNVKSNTCYLSDENVPNLERDHQANNVEKCDTINTENEFVPIGDDANNTKNDNINTPSVQMFYKMENNYVSKCADTEATKQNLQNNITHDNVSNVSPAASTAKYIDEDKQNNSSNPFNTNINIEDSKINQRNAKTMIMTENSNKIETSVIQQSKATDSSSECLHKNVNVNNVKENTDHRSLTSELRLLLSSRKIKE